MTAPREVPDGDRPDLTALVEEMTTAWRRGERPAVETFLERAPALDDEGAIRLIYEDVCLREEAGLKVDPASVVARFPRWRAELELIFDFQRLLEPRPDAVAAATFPAVGEVVGGFRLLSELGRGTAGRVFLAAQPALADRPVVVKITSSAREEHLSLARLQHHNIVPLYSEQVLHARDLRILCMPYLGGATLASLLDRLRAIPPEERTGRDLIAALDQNKGAPPAQGPYRASLARASYVEAICWIGACLADGLRFAHEQGLVHMDVKPSNVLLTATGQPMLLDFHLAQGPIDPGRPSPRRLGGTPGYLAPEHEAALTAIRDGRAIGRRVDGRADLYALGLLLHEALGDPYAAPAAVRPPLCRVNRAVSRELSDLVAKCLRPDPADRYPDAGAVAADLRRHLNHMPLVGVPTRSLGERWRKWRRRDPEALPRRLIGAVALAVALGGAVVLASAQRRHARALEAARASDRALRDRRAEELHRVADLIRFRVGLAPRSPDEARALLGRVRALWESRDRLALALPGAAPAATEGAGTVRADLLDLATIGAELRVRLAPEIEREEARRDALRWLDAAARECGTGPVLDRVRRELAGADDLNEPPPSAAPRTAWEHCDLGRAFLRDRDYARASDEFQKALDLRPQDFWPNFYLGYCAYRRGRFDDAAVAFRICVALAPEAPECHVNLALAEEGRGRTAEALRAFAKARQLDRGTLDPGVGRHADALAGQARDGVRDPDRGNFREARAPGPG